MITTKAAHDGKMKTYFFRTAQYLLALQREKLYYQSDNEIETENNLTKQSQVAFTENENAVQTTELNKSVPVWTL